MCVDICSLAQKNSVLAENEIMALIFQQSPFMQEIKADNRAMITSVLMTISPSRVIHCV